MAEVAKNRHSRTPSPKRRSLRSSRSSSRSRTRKRSRTRSRSRSRSRSSSSSASDSEDDRRKAKKSKKDKKRKKEKREKKEKKEKKERKEKKDRKRKEKEKDKPEKKERNRSRSDNDDDDSDDADKGPESTVRTGPPKKLEIVASTPFGMVEKELIAPGAPNAPRPQSNQRVTVQGSAYLHASQGGKLVWTTRDKYGQPLTFQLGKELPAVPRGWQLGIAQMQLGERAKLTVSPSFCFGVHGYAPWNVPGGATLVLDLHLTKIQ